MAKYLPLPDGSTIKVPDDMPYDVAMSKARDMFPDLFADSTPKVEPKTGIGAALGKGFESTLSQLRSGIAGLLGSPEEAAQAGLERGKGISKRYADQIGLEQVKKAYEEQGLLPAALEVGRQAPLAIAEQAPQIAGTMGSAALGSRLGAVAGLPFGPVGSLVGQVAGGALGAFAPSFIQQFGGNIERQATEQTKAGKPVAIERGAAAAAAVPQGLLDVAGNFIPLGKPLLGKIFGSEVKQLLEKGAEKGAEKLAQESIGKVLAKGTLIGGLAEVPTEIAQQVLERAQAGLSLTDDDALKEYADTAYQVGLLAPIGAAGRYMERGAARANIEAKKAEAEAQQAKVKREAEEARLQSPDYLMQVSQELDALQQQRADLQAQLIKETKAKPLDDADKAANTEINKQLAELAPQLKLKAQEFNRAGGKPALAKLQEARRVEAMTPLDYQMEQAGVTFPQEAPAAEVTPPGVFLGEQMAAVPEASPAQQYAQRQMDLAKRQDMGTFDEADYAAYLMQDPYMAQQVVANKIPIPGVDKKTSNAILGAMNLQLKGAVTEQLKQQQADLAAQQKKVAPDAGTELWKQSLADAEAQAREDLTSVDWERALTPTQAPTVKVADNIQPIQRASTLLGRLDDLVDARDRAAKDAQTAISAGNRELAVKKYQEQEAAQTSLNQIENTEGPAKALVALRKAQDTALMNTASLADDLRSDRTLGAKTNVAEELAASLKNANWVGIIGNIEGPARPDAYNVSISVDEAKLLRAMVVKTILDGVVKGKSREQIIAQIEGLTKGGISNSGMLRINQLLSPLDAPKDLRGTASSTPQTLVSQINKQRSAFTTAAIQEAAITRKLFGKGLTEEEAAKATKDIHDVFNEWVTRTLAAPRSEALEERVTQPAQMRGTEVVRGAETEKFDPRPLAERQFGAYRAATEVLQDQLRKITTRLTEVPFEGKRVTPELKTQFAATEAAKVAEARGETAKTAEGALRRRRDYVNTLIDQAFQTRRVPGIAQMLLTRSKDFLESGRGVGNMLDAAENIASRIVRGQNIERSDLVALRDELRAESARPGEAEVVGEREKQRELFPAEERRTPLGTIRETRAKFENAPVVKRAREAVKRGKQLFEDIKTAWTAADEAQAKVKEAKIAAAEGDVAKKRAAYREVFDTTLQKNRVNQAVEQVQQEMAAVMDSLAAVGRERAKAIKVKDKESVADLDVILKAEREALAEVKAKLDLARRAPGAVLEPAEMPRGATKQTREFTLPYELKTAGDEWVAFERERLAKAEAKLAKLKGPEKAAQVKEVATQRRAVQEAENITLRAQQGLGLPGVRRVAGKTEAIKSAQERTTEAAAAEEERRATVREEAEASRKAKEAAQTELEQRVLDLGTELADKEGQLARAKTDASKERLRSEIEDINKETQLAQAQLDALGEAKPRRKGPATAPSTSALSKQKPLRTGYRKALEAAAEGVRSEREGEAQLESWTLDDVKFSRGKTSNPSTTETVRTELKPHFPNLGRVKIYDSVDALIKDNPQYEGRVPDDARGFVDTAGNKAFLIAENINQGQALSVLLHEVGAHIGLKETLGEGQYNAFVSAVEKWQKADPESVEGRVARAAQARVEAAETPKAQQRDELLAYAIEEAVNAGITPQTKSSLGQWLGRIVQRLEAAFRKFFGMEPKDISLRDLVNMAYGAAKVEMTPAVPQMTRRQFLRGAGAALGAMKLPSLSKDMEVTALKKAFESSLDIANTWFSAARAATKSKGLKTLLGKYDDLYEGENATANFVRTNALKNFLYRTTYDENYQGDGYDHALTQLLEKDGLKVVADLQQALQAQRSALVDAVQKYSKEKGILPEVGELFFSKAATYSPEFANVGKFVDRAIGEKPSAYQNFKANMLGLAGRTQFVDKLAPVEKVVGMTMDSLKALQTMFYLRMYDQRMHFTSEAIAKGAPKLVEKLRKDGTKEFLIEAQEGATIKDVVGILSKDNVKKAAGSADAVNKMFTLYLAGIRAKRVGLNKLGFVDPKTGEQLVTQAELDSLAAKVNANPVLKEAFENARATYNEYNKNLLEFAVESGAINQHLAAQWIAEKDYVPYYRLRKDGVVELVIGNETPIRIGNLKDSPQLEALKGGEDPLLDFLTSSVQNTSMLLDMSLKNLAQKNLAWELRDVGLAKLRPARKGESIPANAFEFKEKGVDHFAIFDEEAMERLGVPPALLVKGLAGIPTMFPSITRILGIPSRVLRRMVVANPVYVARQMFRDSLAATLTSGADIAPVLSSLKEIGKDHVLQARGVTGGQVFTGMPEDISRLLKDMQEGRSGWEKALSKMEQWSANADAATRRAQYENYLKQGLSEMEATYMALESMNFSRRGLSPSVHMLNTLIPFLNAQIVGLDVLYRSFRGKMPMNDRLKIREKLFTRGLFLAGMSVAYAAMMQDDEAYKNATPDQKYGNWFLRLPFLDQFADEPVYVKVPIPFELGYVFKALPEAMVNTAMTKHGGEEAAKAFKQIAINLVPGLSSMMIPQAIKPVVEVVAGHSFYNQRPIESAREQMLEPFARYRDDTSEAAKLVGKMFNISPIKIEALVRGYTGSLGLTMLQALSFGVPTTAPEKASKRLAATPIIGGLFQPVDAGGIIDATYERMKEVQEIKKTYDNLLEKNEKKEAAAYAEAHINDMVLAAFAGNFERNMGVLTKRERQIAASDKPPQEKRRLLDEIRQFKIKYATSVREGLDRKVSPVSP